MEFWHHYPSTCVWLGCNLKINKNNNLINGNVMYIDPLLIRKIAIGTSMQQTKRIYHIIE